MYRNLFEALLLVLLDIYPEMVFLDHMEGKGETWKRRGYEK
jgi:hypothetical protein